MAEKTRNIYQKLVEVRKEVTYLQKSAQGEKFNYVASSQVLASVRDKMDELGLFLEIEVLDRQVNVRERVQKYQNGNEKISYQYEAELDIEFTWINAENPEEKITKKWFSMGLDIGDNSKSVGKAVTYAEKYFLLKTFNIPTDKDDPDSFQTNNEMERQKKEERKQQQKPADKEEVEKFIETAKTFGEVRNQPLEAVLKVFQINGENQAYQLPKATIEKNVEKLNTWIEKAKQEKKGA